MIHYTDHYLINPRHPITVNLVGCGGTGSQVLSKLGLLHTTLRKLNHMGLHVRVFDDDKVEAPNLGRQLFFESDVGQFKATVLVNRVNRAFGTNWESHPYKYARDSIQEEELKGANILISCVDTGKARKEIAQIQGEYIKNYVHEHSSAYQVPYYWLDYGNGKDTGQVILGTQRKLAQPQSQFNTVNYLPTVVDMFPNIDQVDKEDSSPSCSTEEALLKQDLFTNCMLVPFGMQILWKLFREAKIEEQGAYVNMKTLKSNPIKIKEFMNPKLKAV